MFDHVYAELPPHLAEQREQLERALAGAQPAADDETPSPPMRGQRTTRR
jgi:hypothetical protein